MLLRLGVVADVAVFRGELKRPLLIAAVHPGQISAGLEGRRQIAEYFNFLKHEVPGFANSSIVDIAAQIGVRQTRRIQGAYALTGDDILTSCRFDDAIGINAWPMELHSAGRIDWQFPINGDSTDGRVYNDLPWRMLVPNF